jgi:hypothetical protein
MIGFLENPEIDDQQLVSAYRDLVNESDFLDLVTSNTTDTITLQNRIRMVKSQIANASQ